MRWEQGEEKRTGGFIRVRIISPPGSFANSAEKATISPLYKRRGWRAARKMRRNFRNWNFLNNLFESGSKKKNKDMWKLEWEKYTINLNFEDAYQNIQFSVEAFIAQVYRDLFSSLSAFFKKKTCIVFRFSLELILLSILLLIYCFYIIWLLWKLSFFSNNGNEVKVEFILRNRNIHISVYFRDFSNINNPTLRWDYYLTLHGSDIIRSFPINNIIKKRTIEFKWNCHISCESLNSLIHTASSIRLQRALYIYTHKAPTELIIE